MDFLTAIQVVLRRWYVVFPVLALSAVLTFKVAERVPPSYKASGSVLLASPGASNDARAVNPFTNLDYSAGVVAGIVANLMQDPGVKTRLVSAGADPDYTLGTPAGTNAPLIGVDSSTATPQVAVNTVRIVIRGIQDELAIRQRDAGGPPETWIRAIVLTSPEQAERQTGAKVRALAALSALSVATAACVAFLVESVAVGRRRRAIERQSTDGPGPSVAEPPGPPEAATPVTPTHR